MLVVEKDTDIRKKFVECRVPHPVKEQVHVIHDLRVFQSLAVEPTEQMETGPGYSERLSYCAGCNIEIPAVAGLHMTPNDHSEGCAACCTLLSTMLLDDQSSAAMCTATPSAVRS